MTHHQPAQLSQKDSSGILISQEDLRSVIIWQRVLSDRSGPEAQVRRPIRPPKTAADWSDLMSEVGRGSVLSRVSIFMLVYLVAIAGVEALVVWNGPVIGALGDAILIVFLLSQYALLHQDEDLRTLLVLVLIPLLRLLSLAMPVRQTPQIYWYAFIAIPLLVCVGLILRLLDLSWADVGVRQGSWGPQLLIALSGLPLGIAAFFLLRPRPLVAGFRWYDWVLALLIVVIFTAFTEEIIFRGVLQQTASQIFGNAAIWFCSALFAIMYMGSLSLPYICFMGIVGVFFGWCVSRTGSIWGVTLAHSALNIGMMLLWPVLWL